VILLSKFIKKFVNLENFFSRENKNLLLHQLYKPDYNLSENRINISPESESLQVAYMKLKKNQTFKAHKHINFDRNMPRAQESWVVIKGRVRIFYYDLNDELITSREMIEGGCTITYMGGHNYEALEEGTIVYEFKTGPYLGLEKDKTFLFNQCIKN